MPILRDGPCEQRTNLLGQLRRCSHDEACSVRQTVVSRQRAAVRSDDAAASFPYRQARREKALGREPAADIDVGVELAGGYQADVMGRGAVAADALGRGQEVQQSRLFRRVAELNRNRGVRESTLAGS